MRKFLVGMAGGLIALAGFAGAASASATIDLIWAASGTNTTSIALASSNITLNVILTAGANGSAGGGMSIDYTALVADFSVVSFQSFQGGPLPLGLGATTDTGTQIRNINATVFAPPGPDGLLAGQSYLLGTVVFHLDTATAGSFQITSGDFAPTDDILDGFYNVITPTTTFNSAFAVVPEPSTLSLLGMGLGGLYGVGRRMRPKR